MWIYAANSASETPLWFANGRAIPAAYDPVADLAVIKLVDMSGFPTRAIGRDPIEIRNIELGFGDEIKVLGYPGLGGETITITSGEISGWFPDAGGDFYKSSARSGPGVSGGAAFDAITGEYVGTPSAGSTHVVGEALVLIRPSSYALSLLQAALQAG
jgi:S1-C subfamily serine protease